VKPTTKEKAMTKKYTIEDAIKKINGRLTQDQKHVIYYDDNACQHYLAPIGDLEHLADLMNDEDSDIARDAYSHWCAYTAHPECDENGQQTKTYYIYTDAGSEEIEAASIEEALTEWGEAPEWVQNAQTFEEWLKEIGGYGAIQEDGVEIARVDA
jgi:hypothetical protein